jgi:hypothetical protein
MRVLGGEAHQAGVATHWHAAVHSHAWEQKQI